MPRYVFTCGAHGALFRSVDHGVTWRRLYSSTRQHLHAIACADPNHGDSTPGTVIAVGAACTIVRSVDYGVRWQTVHTAARSSTCGDAKGNGENDEQEERGEQGTATPCLMDVCIYGKHIAACGSHGVCVVSQDAGQTWNRLVLDPSPCFLTACCLLHVSYDSMMTEEGQPPSSLSSPSTHSTTTPSRTFLSLVLFDALLDTPPDTSSACPRRITPGCECVQTTERRGVETRRRPIPTRSRAVTIALMEDPTCGLAARGTKGGVHGFSSAPVTPLHGDGLAPQSVDDTQPCRNTTSTISTSYWIVQAAEDTPLFESGVGVVRKACVLPTPDEGDDALFVYAIGGIYTNYDFTVRLRWTTREAKQPRSGLAREHETDANTSRARGESALRSTAERACVGWCECAPPDYIPFSQSGMQLAVGVAAVRLVRDGKRALNEPKLNENGSCAPVSLVVRSCTAGVMYSVDAGTTFTFPIAVKTGSVAVADTGQYLWCVSKDHVVRVALGIDRLTNRTQHQPAAPPSSVTTTRVRQHRPTNRSETAQEEDERLLFYDVAYAACTE